MRRQCFACDLLKFSRLIRNYYNNDKPTILTKVTGETVAEFISDHNEIKLIRVSTIWKGVKGIDVHNEHLTSILLVFKLKPKLIKHTLLISEKFSCFKIAHLKTTASALITVFIVPSMDWENLYEDLTHQKKYEPKVIAF